MTEPRTAAGRALLDALTLHEVGLHEGDGLQSVLERAAKKEGTGQIASPESRVASSPAVMASGAGLSLPEQLRGIADRIESAESELLVAQADLWRLAGALPADVVDLAADAALLNPAGSSIEDSQADEQPVAAMEAAPRILANGHLGCPHCPKEFRDRRGYPAHVRGHSQRPVTPPGRGATPPLIGKAASPPRPVIRNGKESYLCPRCDQAFSTVETRVAHLQKGHPPAATPTLKPVGKAPNTYNRRDGTVAVGLTSGTVVA